MATMTKAGAKIIALAQHHGVTAERTATDAMADDFARLSDAEVPPDPIMDLVVALQRAGVVSDSEANALYGAHLQEEAVPSDTRPLRERLAPTLDMARKFGPYGLGDHKQETDEMWGEDN